MPIQVLPNLPALPLISALTGDINLFAFSKVLRCKSFLWKLLLIVSILQKPTEDDDIPGESC